MKKACVNCRKEFDARGKIKTCSAGCRCERRKFTKAHFKRRDCKQHPQKYLAWARNWRTRNPERSKYLMRTFRFNSRKLKTILNLYALRNAFKNTNGG